MTSLNVGLMNAAATDDPVGRQRRELPTHNFPRRVCLDFRHKPCSAPWIDGLRHHRSVSHDTRGWNNQRRHHGHVQRHRGASLVYVSPGQINALVPYGVAGQSTVNVVVTRYSLTTAPFAVSITNSSPGIFTATENGSGQGAILNVPANPSDLTAYTYNGTGNPAPQGSVIVVFRDGYGRLEPGRSGRHNQSCRHQVLGTAGFAHHRREGSDDLLRRFGSLRSLGDASGDCLHTLRDWLGTTASCADHRPER